MSSIYSWVVDKAKYERAVAEVRGDNPNTNETGTREVTEEAVKKVYIRLLGLVREKKVEAKSVEEATDSEETPRRGRPNKVV